MTATDWSAPAIELTTRNAASQRGRSRGAALLVAGAGAAVCERGPWPLVLASDVLYDRANVDLLLDLLPQLTDRRSEVLIADPGRPPAAEFLERARERWRVESHPAPGKPSVGLHLLSRRAA